MLLWHLSSWRDVWRKHKSPQTVIAASKCTHPECSHCIGNGLNTAQLHISPITLQATKYILDTANNRQCTVNNTPVHNRLHLTQMGRAQLYKAVPQCISCTVLCIEHCTQHALECTAIGFVSSSEQTACLHLWLPANPSPLASPSSSSLSSSPSLS